MHGDQVPCVEHRDHEDVAAHPSLEGVGDDPNVPDVDGVFHAGLEGDDLVLSEGHVLVVPPGLGLGRVRPADLGVLEGGGGQALGEQ